MPEICKDICTTEAIFSKCTDGGEIVFYISDGKAISFPEPPFNFQGCEHCHNLSHINITCSSKAECMGGKNTSEKPENFQKVEEVSSSFTSPQTIKSSQPEAMSSTTGNSPYRSFCLTQYKMFYCTTHSLTPYSNIVLLQEKNHW